MVAPPWPLILPGLEFPAVLALLDRIFGPADHVAEGAPDRRSWIGWLTLAVPSVPILVGFLALIGHYHVVVRRISPASHL